MSITTKKKEYMVFRVQKLKDRNHVKSACDHNKRDFEGEAPNVDVSRSQSNTYYSPGTEIGLSAMDYFDFLMSSTAIDGRNKNVGVEVLIGMSPEAKDRVNHEQFYADAKAALFEWFGSDNVISADMHKDESTPHAHAVIVPRIERNLCASRARRKENQKGETHRISMMHYLGIEKRGGYSKFQDFVFERVGNKHGLSRGEKGSLDEHMSQKEYRRYLQKAHKSKVVDLIELESVKKANAKLSNNLMIAEANEAKYKTELDENKAEVKKLRNLVKDIPLLDVMSALGYQQTGKSPDGDIVFSTPEGEVWILDNAFEIIRNGERIDYGKGAINLTMKIHCNNNNKDPYSESVKWLSETLGKDDTKRCVAAHYEIVEAPKIPKTQAFADNRRRGSEKDTDLILNSLIEQSIDEGVILKLAKNGKISGNRYGNLILECCDNKGVSAGIIEYRLDHSYRKYFGENESGGAHFSLFDSARENWLITQNPLDALALFTAGVGNVIVQPDPNQIPLLGGIKNLPPKSITYLGDFKNHRELINQYGNKIVGARPEKPRNVKNWAEMSIERLVQFFQNFFEKNGIGRASRKEKSKQNDLSKLAKDVAKEAVDGMSIED